MKKSNALKSLLLSLFLALPLVSCEEPNSESNFTSESTSTSQEESWSICLPDGGFEGVAHNARNTIDDNYG